MLKKLFLAPLVVALLAAFTSKATASTGACEKEIQSAAAKYGIPAGILYSVGLTETGRKGSLQPYAMNIEGKAYFATSPSRMLCGDSARRCAQGAKLIDLGCMQINHHFHGENFRSAERDARPAEECRIRRKLPVQSSCQA